MMTKEGFTKIVYFMSRGAGILVLGCGHTSHIVKLHYLKKKNSSLFAGIDQIYQVFSNDDQGRDYQNC